MTVPKIGLFARFFVLFTLTIALITFSLLAAYWVTDEREALAQLEHQHDLIVSRFEAFASKPLDHQLLYSTAEEIKGAILVQRDGTLTTTDPNFPALSELLPISQPVGSLRYAKYGYAYYLLYELQDGWIAVTSAPVNALVYVPWIAHWPWLLLCAAMVGSYWLLRRWLQPVVTATQVVSAIGQGDLAVRVGKHPSNELSDLTKGINQMAEQIERVIAGKNELLLATSHELRTPLARLRVSLAMLEESPHAQAIESDVQVMERLIEQLLEGERLQAGFQVLHCSRVYLPMVVEDVLQEDDAFANVETVGNVPEMAVTIDVGRFKFLLRNLLQNALQYTQPGTKVQLRLTEVEDGFLVAVRDFGEGIAEKDLAFIFEPFYRGGTRPRGAVDGVGLGLYLCAQIARAHGGDLKVTSELGKGSCFTAYFCVS